MAPGHCPTCRSAPSPPGPRAACPEPLGLGRPPLAVCVDGWALRMLPAPALGSGGFGSRCPGRGAPTVSQQRHAWHGARGSTPPLTSQEWGVAGPAAPGGRTPELLGRSRAESAGLAPGGAPRPGPAPTSAPHPRGRAGGGGAGPGGNWKSLALGRVTALIPPTCVLQFPSGRRRGTSPVRRGS